PRTAERAKRGAYLRLLQEAAIAGANAVIGVSIETYVVANTIVCASATGTAVMIEPADK
ncbi:MAG: heavy metal-binding domain-containing protein, partial [Coriobacteriales bacterium]